MAWVVTGCERSAYIAVERLRHSRLGNFTTHVTTSSRVGVRVAQIIHNLVTLFLRGLAGGGAGARTQQQQRRSDLEAASSSPSLIAHARALLLDTTT